MASTHDASTAIKWYRTPIPAGELRALNTRSDIKGLIQAGGFLTLLCCTGAASLWSAFFGHVWLTLVLLFLHGTVGSFLSIAEHELSHNTVFQTKWLNALFIRIFGFLGWYDFHFFRASHANHHRYTLHPPRDGEVVIPDVYASVSLRHFLCQAFWLPLAPFRLVKGTLRKARGQWDDDWSLTLFPKDKVEACRRLMRWNRSVLAGHAIIVAGSGAVALITGRWAWLLVPYVVSFSMTYGGWLYYLCSFTMHIGLMDKIPDFRFCCRTMILPRIASFLYWHMEYHTEHHMYAAVPCYNLRALRQTIENDLPRAKGMIATWKEIAQILRKQAKDPGYQHIHELPNTAHPIVRADRA